MNSKIIGGIFFIAGTSIGGGMLGLPIATAEGGVFPSSLLLIGCWALMAFTGLLTLEVNLCFPRHSHIISMAKATLGRPGEFVCWTIYLLFLYAIVSAYIVGGQDVLNGLLLVMSLKIPLWICGVAFVCIFGSIVMAGIRHVDIFNRLLMIVKLITLILLMLLISVHISSEHYHHGGFRYLLPAVSVAITSFGYSVIVPTLRIYFNDDIKLLRIVILVGSFIPLLCYLIWDAVIFGVVPFNGEFGLERLMHADQPITGLLESITYYVPTANIKILARTFTSICVLTAFGCVSLSLADYLADGFQVEQEGRGKVLVAIATFLPPLLIAILYPQAFILFLSLAGVLCVALLALMPALMAWSCRYYKKMPMPYQVIGGKFTLALSIFISILIIIGTLYQLIYS